jgi:signal transduction histidine kinase
MARSSAHGGGSTQFPRRWLLVSVGMTFVMLVSGTLVVWRLYGGFSDLVSTDMQIRALSGEILRLDEVLTMSARMAAATGDPQWEARYLENEPRLDAAIKQTMSLAPEAFIGASAAATDAANARLVAMETRAFELVREGKAKEAREILFSRGYEEQKAKYSLGMTASNAALMRRGDLAMTRHRTHIAITAAVCVAALLVLGLTWWRTFKLLIGYLRARDAAESALGAANEDLEQRTRDLHEKTEELEATIAELSATQEKLALADRLASIGQLSAGVAHELNNPLSYVMLNLESLRVELSQVSPEVGECISDALDGAERMRKIVEGLRAFARAERERRQSVDLHEVVTSALRIAENEVRHRARVQLSLGPVPPVDADPSRLSQVFLNLILNAVRSLGDPPPSGHEILLRTYTGDGGEAVIDVEDTGTGIPNEIKHKIFDPFFTTRPVGTGTGLGLSICHGIVTSYGGEISVQSEPGERTRFTVRIPPGQLVPSSDEIEAASGVLTVRRRVLLVDDEPLLLTALARSLSAHYEVVTAESGARALAELGRGAPFDVILCDLMMPDLTGMEVFAEASRRAPDVAGRFVFLTGGVFTPDAKAFLETHANMVIEKPFIVSAVCARIEELCEAAPRHFGG